MKACLPQSLQTGLMRELHEYPICKFKYPSATRHQNYQFQNATAPRNVVAAASIVPDPS